MKGNFSATWGKTLTHLQWLQDKQESHWSTRPDSSRHSHTQLTLSVGPGLDSMSPQVSNRLRKKGFFHEDELEQGQGNLFFKDLKLWEGLEWNKGWLIRTTSSSSDMREQEEHWYLARPTAETTSNEQPYLITLVYKYQDDIFRYYERRESPRLPKFGSWMGRHFHKCIHYRAAFNY